MGIVHWALRRPYRAMLRGLRRIRDRVGQGRGTASEPEPDIGPVPVHRLEDRNCVVLLHPHANAVGLLERMLTALRPD